MANYQTVRTTVKPLHRLYSSTCDIFIIKTFITKRWANFSPQHEKPSSSYWTEPSGCTTDVLIYSVLFWLSIWRLNIHKQLAACQAVKNDFLCHVFSMWQETNISCYCRLYIEMCHKQMHTCQFFVYTTLSEDKPGSMTETYLTVLSVLDGWCQSFPQFWL